MTLNTKKYKENVVYLCQPCYENSKFSASPFCNKVEAWLKFAKVDYEIQHTFKKGPNGKWPYVRFNGEIIADSSVIIETLGKRFQIDLNAHLKPEEVAIARSFQLLIENHFFWSVAYYYWYDREIFRNQFMPLISYSVPSFIRGFVYLYIIHPLARWRLYVRGIGALTPEHIQDIAEKDLEAISLFLKDKKYFMGEKKSIVDATVFGFLGSMVRSGIDTPAVRSLKKYKNLINYVARIQNELNLEQ